jgi:hypothetical protein
MKKDNRYLSKKFEKEEQSTNIDNLICQVSKNILNSGEHIWDAA